MSIELINTLENRVTNAVDAIEGLRSEVKVLKEEKQFLEDRLRQLLQKIDGVEETSTADETPTITPEPAENDVYSFGRPGMDPSSSDF